MTLFLMLKYLYKGITFLSWSASVTLKTISLPSASTTFVPFGAFSSTNPFCKYCNWFLWFFKDLWNVNIIHMAQWKFLLSVFGYLARNVKYGRTCIFRQNCYFEFSCCWALYVWFFLCLKYKYCVVVVYLLQTIF